MFGELDHIFLSRIQFAFTVGFHIIFPTLTIGLAAFLAFVEALWLRTADRAYYRLYQFWVKIFALTFGMGVVSGIVLTYQFGTNFSRFSEITGPVLGPLISVEVLTAFFVEAGFLGVMLFGWQKVGPRLHFMATLLVMLGTLNSAFWILSANSWMHTPAGASFVDGRFVPDDWWAIVFNPSFPYRLFHMGFASFLTSAFIIAGLSAWMLLRGRSPEVARKGLSLGLLMAVLLAPAQIVVGDLHGLNVKEYQPMKIAAMEGIWETERGVPLLLFAWPDMEAETNRYEIGIPKLASFILTHEWDGEVKGLKEVAPWDRPYAPIVFWSFRLMVGIGFVLLAVALFGLVQRWRGRMYDSPLLLWACVLTIPLGHVATLAGWVTAEVGRQPYTVHGLLRTADSVSPVSPAAVAASLALFVVVYLFLFAVYLFFVGKVVGKGAPDEEPPPETIPQAMRGAHPAYVIPAE